MQKKPASDTPFKNLGSRLKSVRQRSAETLAEVSGAVEIEEEILANIEAGKIRPSEELLELLADHFNLKDPEVMKLLELAGYIHFEAKDIDEPDASSIARTIVMILSHDNKTSYTDGLDIHYDSNGLTFNFTQNVGLNKPITVSKLGMSYEQAVQVHKTLSKVLHHVEDLKEPAKIPRSTRSTKKNIQK